MYSTNVKIKKNNSSKGNIGKNIHCVKGTIMIHIREKRYLYVDWIKIPWIA